MESLFKLNIFTPYAHYLSKDVNFISVCGEEYVYGIMPHHAAMVAKVKISHLKVVSGNEVIYYAIGGGIMQIDDSHNVTLLLDSIESKDEIDLPRAEESKSRAEKRIADPELVDLSRAKASLLRALNRIDLVSKD